VPRKPATTERAIGRSPLLERLTFAALLIGLIAGTSYAVGAADLVRTVRPALGAWLDAHQFYMMEGGATAFGLILGMRIGRRLAADTAGAAQTTSIALILAVVALSPLIYLCARAARFGWAGRGGIAVSWIIGRAGYANGTRLYKLLITAIYFLKTAGLAAIAGLVLIGLAVAMVIARDATGSGESPRGT
jgi:hypothetical protein